MADAGWRCQAAKELTPYPARRRRAISTVSCASSPIGKGSGAEDLDRQDRARGSGAQKRIRTSLRFQASNRGVIGCAAAPLGAHGAPLRPAVLFDALFGQLTRVIR